MKNMKKIFCMVLVLTTLLATFIFPVQTSAADIDAVILGGSIRVDGSAMQGLRFVGKIKKNVSGISFSDLSDSNNFGILLIPKAKLNNGSPVVYNTSGVVTVKAKMVMSDASISAAGLTPDSNYYFFSAVLTGIPAESVGTEIVARVYLNRSGTYVYSDQQVRSAYSVATALKAGGATGTTLTACNAVISNYSTHGQNIYVNVGSI